MGDRPRGITLVCVLFGVVGVLVLLAGIGMLRDLVWGTVSPNRSEWTVVIVYVIPVVTILYGIVAVETAIALLNARPRGRLVGLALIVLWLGQFALIEIWSLAGSEIAREVGSGPGGYVLHFLAGALIFSYLWTAGSAYVDGGSADQPSPAPTGER